MNISFSRIKTNSKFQEINSLFIDSGLGVKAKFFQVSNFLHEPISFPGFLVASLGLPGDLVISESNSSIN